MSRFYQWRLTKYELYRLFVRCGFYVHCIKPVDKSQGATRLLNKYSMLLLRCKVYHLVKFMLAKILTRDYVCHMLLGIGQKAAR